MSATSRAGALLLLAACGGGDRAARSDTTAMATTPPPAEQPSAVPVDSGMRADTAAPPAAAPAAPAAPAETAKPAPAAKPAPKPAATPTPPPTPPPGRPQDTAAAAKPPAKPAGGAGPASAQQVALGDSIFHGQVAGGTCTACHGQDAKGTVIAPDLTDGQWLNGDGSYEFIVNTVTNGVPAPKQHPAPMPPKGGAALTDDQVKAVAAYVYSLSHKS